jgi:hypothetical protein
MDRAVLGADSLTVVRGWPRSRRGSVTTQGDAARVHGHADGLDSLGIDMAPRMTAPPFGPQCPRDGATTRSDVPAPWLVKVRGCHSPLPERVLERPPERCYQRALAVRPDRQLHRGSQAGPSSGPPPANSSRPLGLNSRVAERYCWRRALTGVNQARVVVSRRSSVEPSIEGGNGMSNSSWVS